MSTSVTMGSSFAPGLVKGALILTDLPLASVTKMGTLTACAIATEIASRLMTAPASLVVITNTVLTATRITHAFVTRVSKKTDKMFV